MSVTRKSLLSIYKQNREASSSVKHISYHQKKEEEFKFEKSLRQYIPSAKNSSTKEKTPKKKTDEMNINQSPSPLLPRISLQQSSSKKSIKEKATSFLPPPPPSSIPHPSSSSSLFPPPPSSSFLPHLPSSFPSFTQPTLSSLPSDSKKRPHSYDEDKENLKLKKILREEDQIQERANKMIKLNDQKNQWEGENQEKNVKERRIGDNEQQSEEGEVIESRKQMKYNNNDEIQISHCQKVFRTEKVEKIEEKGNEEKLGHEGIKTIEGEREEPEEEKENIITAEHKEDEEEGNKTGKKSEKMEEGEKCIGEKIQKPSVKSEEKGKVMNQEEEGWNSEKEEGGDEKMKNERRESNEEREEKLTETEVSFGLEGKKSEGNLKINREASILDNFMFIDKKKDLEEDKKNNTFSNEKKEKLSISNHKKRISHFELREIKNGSPAELLKIEGRCLRSSSVLKSIKKEEQIGEEIIEIRELKEVKDDIIQPNDLEAEERKEEKKSKMDKKKSRRSSRISLKKKNNIENDINSSPIAPPPTSSNDPLPSSFFASPSYPSFNPTTSLSATPPFALPLPLSSPPDSSSFEFSSFKIIESSINKKGNFALLEFPTNSIEKKTLGTTKVITPLKKFEAHQGNEVMEDLLGLDRKKIGYIPFDEKLRKIIIEKERDEEEGWGNEEEEGMRERCLKDVGKKIEEGGEEENEKKDDEGVEEEERKKGGRGKKVVRRGKKSEGGVKKESALFQS